MRSNVASCSKSSDHFMLRPFHALLGLSFYLSANCIALTESEEKRETERKRETEKSMEVKKKVYRYSKDRTEKLMDKGIVKGEQRD